MKLRCELHLPSHESKLLLVKKNEETLEHLALKLAAYVMFHRLRPVVEPSSDHPSLLSVDIRPDVMSADDSGELILWVECGAVTLHKLDKITRRFPRARLVVLKKNLREATRLRTDLKKEVRHAQKIEVWTWPEDGFQLWLSCIGEKTEVFGEAHEKSFNLVMNEKAVAVDLISV